MLFPSLCNLFFRIVKIWVLINNCKSNAAPPVKNYLNFGQTTFEKFANFSKNPQFLCQILYVLVRTIKKLAETLFYLKAPSQLIAVVLLLLFMLHLCPSMFLQPAIRPATLSDTLLFLYSVFLFTLELTTNILYITLRSQKIQLSKPFSVVRYIQCFTDSIALYKFSIQKWIF